MVGMYCGANEEMKVKVGDKIYSAKDQPIMVILDENDRFNIAHMPESVTRYAEFPSDHNMTTEEMLEWMGHGHEQNS